MAFSEEAEVKCYRRSQGNIYKPMVTNGNIVSKKAFLSTVRPKTQFSDGYFMHSIQKGAIIGLRNAEKRGIIPQISAVFLIFGTAILRKSSMSF